MKYPNALSSRQSALAEYVSYLDSLKSELNLAWCYADHSSMLEAERLGSPITPAEWAECAIEDLAEQKDKIAESLNRWKALGQGERDSFLKTAYLHNGVACLVRQTWDAVPFQVSCFHVGDVVFLYGITTHRPIELWETWEKAWTTFLKQSELVIPWRTGIS